MDAAGNKTSADTYDCDFSLEEIKRQTEEHFRNLTVEQFENNLIACGMNNLEEIDNMRNICILETFNDDIADNRLFKWAKKVESLGYEVTQIWESEYPLEDNAVKGINFKPTNEDTGSIFLCVDDSSVYIETEHNLFTNQGYVKFLSELTE